MHPLTILLPCRNSAHRLEACLSSIQGQICSNFKLIISNNNSHDETEEIISGFLKEISFETVVYKQEETLSIHENWQFLYSKVESEYFLFLDSEDCLSRNYVELFYLEANRNPKSLIFVPKFRELGYCGRERDILAPELLTLAPPNRKLLDFFLMPSMMGTGYPIYCVFNKPRTSNLWCCHFKNPNCPSGASDITMALAAIIKYTTRFVAFNGVCSHFSKVTMNKERLEQNEGWDLKSQTHPEVIADVLRGLARYSIDDSLISNMHKLHSLHLEAFFMKRKFIQDFELKYYGDEL
jgi:glycosyltransferase involved in cell wall biosynthesis